MTGDRPWIPVSDQLPRPGWLVETRIGDERGPDLVCYDGVWMRVVDAYDGPAPTHWRLTRPEGCGAMTPEQQADVYPELAASDLDALTALIGGWTFVAAEQTIHDVCTELGLRVTPETRELHERIGRIAERVSDELKASLRHELAQSEQDDTWEPARVVLERMRVNPAARPAPLR